MRRSPSAALLIASLLLAACGRETSAPVVAAQPAVATAPLLTVAPVRGFANPEPGVAPQCYTRTDGASNPCWACHTSRNGRNDKGDWALQESYAFSEPALENHWRGLFTDRRPAIAATSDAEIEAWIATDNYTPLLRAARAAPAADGYAPDLDYAQGFDDAGWARDGSGWRAFRYKPLPGGFWPTNGASDDVLIRLPSAFRRGADGKPSQAVYAANLALVEAAMTVPDTVGDAALVRRIEPVSETAAGLDLDGDDRLATADHLRGLPTHYAGAATAIPLRRWSYPAGTEFLHSLRYVDPDRPGLLSPRLKELRYSIKRMDLDELALKGAYAEERVEKAVGLVPRFPGSPERGLLNSQGWLYQGWIEDGQGALRRQMLEEHYHCLGCHGGLGITVDSSFALPRKPPGPAGWGWQRLDGLQDVPMAGHRAPEILTWFARAGGGDAFRSNDEIAARFFAGGRFDEGAVRRAAPGGDRDLLWLLAPSRERAMALNKAYRDIVRGQDYVRGREPFLRPPENVHRRIANGDTGLRAQERVYSDGRLWLDWEAPAQSRPVTTK